MKTMNLKTAFIAIVFSLGVIGISNAQRQGNGERKELPTYAQLLKQMDANKDGKLEKSEIKGPLKDDFDKVDANEDGFISEEEFKKAPKPKRREERRNK